MMEETLQRKRLRLEALIEELQGSLAALCQLEGGEDLAYTFEIGDTLYARARIGRETSSVGLWLGAGVMLEYGVGEAKVFLGEKEGTRREELARCEHDLAFVRKQLTTMEVNMARLYNYAIRQKSAPK